MKGREATQGSCLDSILIHNNPKNMTSLTTSIKQFASLNRAPGATWTEATKRKAPHKPLLQLAVNAAKRARVFEGALLRLQVEVAGVM